MNQTTADGFFCVFNGKKFLPGEAEVCHLLFLHSVEYTDSAEIAGTPPDGCTAKWTELSCQNYESLLIEARSRLDIRVSEAVERAVTSKMQDIQNKLDMWMEEKNAVENTNRKLIKDQETLQNKYKEIEEREAASLKHRDEKINDLEEQIRDLSIYIEAQKTLSDIADADGIRGGTILPMPSNQASSANTRKHKSGRRRN